jgi:hypothetical protein
MTSAEVREEPVKRRHASEIGGDVLPSLNIR